MAVLFRDYICCDIYVLFRDYVPVWCAIYALFGNYICSDCLIDLFIVLNATFSNFSAISWRPVLVVEEAGVPGENHRPWASKW